MLDRALDVATALEVRGYATAGPIAPRRPARSRHHLAFLAAAVAVLGLAVGARAGGLMDFQAYPSLRVPVPPAQVILAASILACGLMPFAQRRGIAR
jgi:hypothetical protein